MTYLNSAFIGHKIGPIPGLVCDVDTADGFSNIADGEKDNLIYGIGIENQCVDISRR